MSQVSPHVTCRWYYWTESRWITAVQSLWFVDSPRPIPRHPIPQQLKGKISRLTKTVVFEDLKACLSQIVSKFTIYYVFSV